MADAPDVFADAAGEDIRKITRQHPFIRA